MVKKAEISELALLMCRSRECDCTKEGYYPLPPKKIVCVLQSVQLAIWGHHVPWGSPKTTRSIGMILSKHSTRGIEPPFANHTSEVMAIMC